MNQGLRRAGAGALLFGALALGAGCTEEQTGLFIIGNVSLEAPECIGRAEGTTTLVSAGTLDVALRPEYEGSLLVASQLAPRGDKANLRTETMITTITGAEVHLFTDTGEPDPIAPEFTVPATGVISPDSGAEPGFGIITATLIPAAVGLDLAGQLTSRAEVRTRVAEVKVFGKTIGGIEVETAPLSYVIHVCEGCLVSFPSEALDGSGVCSLELDSGPVNPCRVGQDEAVDCRACTSNNSYCRQVGDIP